MKNWLKSLIQLLIKCWQIEILIIVISALTTVESISQNADLSLRYLGTAGWEVTHDDLTILVDPYISRVKLGTGPGISPEDDRRAFTRDDHYVSDTALIDSIITAVDYIFVHHTHFDHMADVPYIAGKTGAGVITTETGKKMLQAYGIPDDKIYTVKGGEDYQFEKFSVKVMSSLHSPLNEKHYFDGRELEDGITAPLKISQFIEGGSLMFLLRIGDHEVMTMGSMNYIEKEIQGLKPDVLLAGVNYSRLQIYKYTDRLMKATGFPATVIPTHWDNFRVPYGFSQESGIELKIKPFIEEVREASPESKVIIPVHLETIIFKAK